MRFRRPTQTRKKWLGVGVVIATLAVVVLLLWQPWRLARVDTGSIYLKEQVDTSNNSVAVMVYIDSKVPVDAVTATIHYNSDRLIYKDTVYSTDAFDSSIPAMTKGDTVQVQVARLGGGTRIGDARVATIRFNVRAGGDKGIGLVAGNAAHAGQGTFPKLDSKLKGL